MGGPRRPAPRPGPFGPKLEPWGQGHSWSRRGGSVNIAAVPPDLFALPTLGAAGAALVLGFFLPGHLLSIALRSRERWATGFVLSLVVLFYGIFALGLLGVPLRFGPVLAYEVMVCTAGWLAARRWGEPAATRERAPVALVDGLMLGATGLLGLLLLLRSTLAPLSGFDTYFRWDFLGWRMLALGRFDFYPPVTPAGFAEYFYPESFPPLVSFAYWWLYAALAAHTPAVTGLFVLTQFGAICLLAYRTATALLSPRAGFLALGVLVSSPLFFRALAIGQETGLTALSVVATVYFLVSARARRDPRAMVLAGLATAVGILSREYGWAFLVFGLVVCLWQRRSAGDVAVFALAAVVAGGPWYVRNWVLTGNPLYPYGLALFDTNPVFAGIMDTYGSRLGVSGWGADQWGAVLLSVFRDAPLPVTLGVAGAVVTFARWGHLAVPVLGVSGLWLWSVGFTSGGAEYASRVLSPAVVVLSILGGVVLARVPRLAAIRSLSAALVVLGLGWGAVHAWAFPLRPEQVPRGLWPTAGLSPNPPPRLEALLPGIVGRVLPPGTRILTDNAYAHAALKETGVDVVPVWSPEVRFVFDPDRDARAVRALLLDRGITAVLYYPSSLNTVFLKRFPFYSGDRDAWIPLAEARSRAFTLYRLPPS